jgi:transcriptional regulator with XRE-family HTH domain
MEPSFRNLNWPAIVEEAIRRRKSEKLSQRALAAIAGVTHPTIVKFEKGDTTITLKTALAVLNALGLVERS